MTDDFRDVAQIDSADDRMDRRSLIKKAAIAGGAAWTAPMIIDSLSSPAAAVSATGCFQMFTFLNQGGAWQAWIPGTLFLLGCNALDACTGTVQDATSDMLAETGLPSPAPPDDSHLTVTVNAPPGCRIAGVGVYVRGATTLDAPDTCVSSNSSINAPRVEITIPPLTRASATIRPKNDGGSMSGFWDNAGLLRSSIFLRLICP